MTEEEWNALDRDFVNQLIGHRMRCDLCQKIVLADDYQWHMEVHHSDGNEVTPARASQPTTLAAEERATPTPSTTAQADNKQISEKD